MAKSNFPSFNEYQAVLQSPAICFSTPELKLSMVETDLWGLPRVRSGGFALTYKLSSSRQQWAVRCFHSFVPDRAQRYVAISTFLRSNPSDIFIPIRFMMKGVLVRGDWYPITYMPWVNGETLETFLVKHVKDQALLQELGRELIRVVLEMERLGVSHGDLSHRNILVRNNKLVLVDYDGMFVPVLAGRKSCEIGNVNFQLPGRSEVHFDTGLDRFSAIVIYLALLALSYKPDMFYRYETGGEGLLFQREDFLNPYQSALLQELENLPDMKALINQFRHICNSEVEMVPRLADFIANRPLDLLRREIPVAPVSPTLVLDARFRSQMLTRVGKSVTVVGKVSEIFRGTSKDGTPHIFLNMGFWRWKCFTIVLWNEALQLCETSGKEPGEYLEQWVSVTGLLTAYEQRPQILINAPTDIQLMNGEAEARKLLGAALSAPGRLAAARPAVLPVAPAPGIRNRKPLEAFPKPAAGVQTSIQTSMQAVHGSLDQTREVIARIEKLFATQNSRDNENPSPTQQ